MVVAITATSFVVHPSISNGFMGNLLYIYSIPAFSLALVAALLLTRGASVGVRRAAVAAAIVLACGSFTLLRTGGITGDAQSDMHWRWTPTPEERLLAQAANEPAPPPATPAAPATSEPATEKPAEPAPATAAPAANAPSAAAERGPDARTASRSADSTHGAANAPANAPAETKAATESHSAVAANMRPAEWPGFRGPDRNSVIHGVRLDTDWSQAAGGDVAPAGRTRLVVVRRAGQSRLHAGTARRRRDRVLLRPRPPARQCGGTATRHAFGSRTAAPARAARRRSATAASTRSARRHRQRARRADRRASCGRATPARTPAQRCRAGASRARRSWSTISSSSPRPAGSSPTSAPPARRVDGQDGRRQLQLAAADDDRRRRADRAAERQRRHRRRAGRWRGAVDRRLERARPCSSPR